MSLSDILVCIDASEAGRGRLKLAAHLARQHGAYLTVAYVVDDSPDAPRGAEQAEQGFRDMLRLQQIRAIGG